MTSEKDLNPSKIAKVEVVFWNQTRAQEHGFDNLLPRGVDRAVIALAKDAKDKILEARLFEGVDGFRLPMDKIYAKEKTNEARVIYGLRPEL